jgi:DNA-binding GntR family transcriptional regulator
MDPDEIYKRLREKIIWLDLMPENYLNLSELAESFNVSRTPIKEVLILLQADGWVLRHGSHFMVTPLSLSRIKEITEIRNIMEVQANLLALERITSKELAALGEIRKEILEIDDVPSNRQLVEIDVKFHRILFQATKNNQLAEVLERLLIHYLRFWLSIPREIDPKSFFTETLEIIQAFETKDEMRLRQISAAHIKNSVDEIMGTF